MKADPDKVAAVVEILRYALRARFAPDDPDKLPTVVFLAWHGMKEAHDALCSYASWLTEQGKPQPNGLQLYVNWRAREGFRPDRKRFANVERDLAIIFAVRELVDAGYSPARNSARTGTPSACALVAEGLGQLGHHLSEDAVEKIWNRKGKGLLSEPPILS